MTAPEPFRLVSFAELGEQPPIRWLIDGLVPDDGLAVLYGAADSFKSFLALGWALCIASGLDWHDHAIERPGHIVYIAAEGQRGSNARARAWWDAQGGPDLDRAHWLPEAVNLRDRLAVERLRRTLLGLPERPRLLVVDTMARCMTGGDENSAKDVGEFVAAVTALPVDTRLVIHHTGKDGRDERGSSALQGAADLRARMERRGRFAELTCSKLKDAEQWRPITLRLEPRQVGSCVLVRAQEPEARAQQRDELAERVFAFVAENGPVSQRAVEREIGGRATFVRDALRALETAGRIVKTAGGWEVRPESGGRTGTQPAGATPAGSASGGGKSP